jgi:hypothetical protein
MRFQRNVKFYTMQRDARLKDINNIGPFIAGSMVKIAHTCGNPNCKCARGDKHENYYLTWKVKQKTRTKYIPVDMEGEVRNWTEQYKRLKKLIAEVTELQRKIIKQHGVEKKAKRKKAAE